jgi:hypothetical protein
MHRSLGAGAAVFIIFMVLTGLAINHSNGLGLDQKHVSQPTLLGWYGLEGPASIRSYRLGENWLTLAGSQAYFNDTNVATLTNGVGAVASGPMLIAAGSNELLLLDKNGQLVERIPWHASGSGVIESIGLLEDESVALKSGNKIWVADAELLDWQHADETISVSRWSTPDPTPKSLHRSITQHYRGEGLSLERLLLDFHSGRIFGNIGVLVYDLLALAVGFLAISGVIFWLTGRRRNGNGKN